MKIGPIGFIVGGVIVIASIYWGTETVLPWYVKLAGAVGLIIYGIFKIMQARDKGA